jgi:thiol:disulfide interchange protein DsbD
MRYWRLLLIMSGLLTLLPTVYAQTDDSAAKNDLLKALTQPAAANLGGGPSEDELPDPDIAFVPTVELKDADTLVATWTIHKCCYMYRERFDFASDTAGITLGEAGFPKGKIKEDEFFGRMETYRDQVVIEIPFQRANSAAQQLDLQTTFQGCADIGVCYPPQKQTIPVMLAALSSGSSSGTGTSGGNSVLGAGADPAPVGPASGQVTMAEQDRIAGMLTEQRFWALPAFFGFGLLLAFTPCVFPMIPILSSIIAGQGSSLTQRRAFILSSVYVLAMALTYTVAGVLAALLGQNIQALFQNPWILVSFSAVFVLLALSMFGFYELQLPVALQTRLAALSNRQQSGNYAGVAIMGFLSALIVGPCVAPPLIGVLTVIGSTGDAMLGGSALFAMSMGMGVPLLAVGTSAGKLLPKAGPWMNAIRIVFGVLLLAVAIWMLERILPEVVSMLLWATLLIVSAVYMGALQSTTGMSGWRTLSKGLGTVMLVYGILLLVGVASGGGNPMQPLRGLTLAGGGNAPQQQQDLNFRLIKTVADLDQQIQLAGGRPVILDFYADWCVDCKQMERYTFSDPQVQSVLADAVLLKADVTANDTADQELLRRFQLIGPPAMLFFSPNGSERPEYRLIGFMGAESFASHARQALQFET